MTFFNSKATPTNDIDYSCRRNCLTNKIHTMPYYTTKLLVARAGGMSSQLVQPNLTMRTMQLNAWVADKFMNTEILFLPLILKC